MTEKNLQRVLIFDGIGESGRNLWIGWVYSKLLRKTMTRKSHQHVGLSLTFFNKAKPYMPNIFNNGSTFNSLNYCRIFYFPLLLLLFFHLENHLKTIYKYPPTPVFYSALNKSSKLLHNTQSKRVRLLRSF